MQTLTPKQYTSMKQGAKILEADSLGEKVLHLHDNTIIKLFRRKTLLSSSLFVPYSKRFARNANKLKALGVPTVKLLALWNLPFIQRTAVHYQPIEGVCLRSYLKTASEAEQQSLSQLLGGFIAQLHNLGVYFRSLHAGNIILTKNNTLGLIDVSDMKFYRKALPISMRIRNFHHFIRYKEDLSLFYRQVIEKMMTYYCDNSGKHSPKMSTLKAMFTNQNQSA